MDGKNKQAAPKQRRRIGFIPIILNLLQLCVSGIVFVAIMFLVWRYESSSAIVENCITCECSMACTSWNKEDFPTGELVVIIPKTLFAGKPNQMIAFAYSPDVFSENEIDEITRRFLRRLNLRENEAAIERLEVSMSVEGFPRIPKLFHRSTCGYGWYSIGKTMYIDPYQLTVWNITFTPIYNRQFIILEDYMCSNPIPSTSSLIIEFAYPQGNHGLDGWVEWCGLSGVSDCETIIGGKVSTSVEIKGYFWSYWYLLPWLVIILFVLGIGIRRMRNRQSLE